MEIIKIITRDNMPCWYELSWQEKPPAIVLRVHKDFIANAKTIPQNAPIVEHFKKEFGFKKFVGSFDKDFGFDDAFKRRKEKGEFIEFVIKIPKVKKKSGKPCGHCNGSGKDGFVDGKCLFCNGKKVEYEYDWKSAYTISASLNIFFSFSKFSENKTISSLLQLMTVDVVTHKDMHGGSLGGQYSIPLVDWLSSFNPGTTITEMIKAMKVAYRRMLGLESFSEYDFRARVDYEGGWLNTSCPGNACGLNPNHGAVEISKKEGRGYEFSCHNTDSPMQQITLLAGLAALHDRARKEIKN